MVVVACVLVLVEVGVELRNLEFGHLSKFVFNSTPKPVLEPCIESGIPNLVI